MFLQFEVEIEFRWRDLDFDLSFSFLKEFKMYLCYFFSEIIERRPFCYFYKISFEELIMNPFRFKY